MTARHAEPLALAASTSVVSNHEAHELTGFPGRLQIGLVWLVRLRWFGAFGASTALLAAGIGVPLSVHVATLWVVLVILSTSNAALTRRLSNVSATLLGGVLAVDSLLLSLVLHGAGGASNPLTVLYLVQITLAGILIGPRWTWLLVGLSIAGYGSLFWGATPASAMHMLDSDPTFRDHLVEMFLAFSLATVVIAHLVTQVASALKGREQELVDAQARVARTERMAALTTLAAGAAHELSTPLGTIAVVARELEYGLAALGAHDDARAALVEDARLIRSEVARCRGILDQMNSRAVEGDEALEPRHIAAIVDEVRQALPAARRERLRPTVAPALAPIAIPPRTFARVLGNLINNAFDASTANDEVSLRVDRVDDRVRFTVRDRGHGMSAELISRAQEPFYTTKAPGKGMGLGLFLARSVAERLRGRLTLESAPGRGTRASLEIPA